MRKHYEDKIFDISREITEIRIKLRPLEQQMDALAREGNLIKEARGDLGSVIRRQGEVKAKMSPLYFQIEVLESEITRHRAEIEKIDEKDPVKIEERKKEKYDKLKKSMGKATTAAEMLKVVNGLKELGHYENAANLATQCDLEYKELKKHEDEIAELKYGEFIRQYRCLFAEDEPIGNEGQFRLLADEFRKLASAGYAKATEDAEICIVWADKIKSAEEEAVRIKMKARNKALLVCAIVPFLSAGVIFYFIATEGARSLTSGEINWRGALLMLGFGLLCKITGLITEIVDEGFSVKGLVIMLLPVGFSALILLASSLPSHGSLPAPQSFLNLLWVHILLSVLAAVMARVYTKNKNKL